MCTIILTRRSDGTPLIGANRNEFYARPASPPSLRQANGRRILAPRDNRAGGTWLGVNEAGLFVGLTNRFGPPSDPQRRSRGEVVDAALGAQDVDDALGRIDDLPADAFNGFHLLVVSRDATGLAIHDGALLTTHPIDPRWAIVTELGLGAADDPRRQRLLPRLRDAGAPEALDVENLQGILSDCQPEGSIEAACVELEGADYGTRSSTIVRLDTRADEAVFLHTDDAPCRSDYTDYNDALRSLLFEGDGGGQA
jgi:uncharacterized protein with NRDE domain